MKQITHEETRKVIVIDGYMADDGTRFKSEWVQNTTPGKT